MCNCWKCTHPDATQEDYFRLIEQKIETYGWFVQHVYGKRPRPPFTYSIGLTDHGRPELVVTGMPQQASARLINDVAHGQLFHDEPPLSPGERRRGPDGVFYEVNPVAEPSAHLIFACALRGPGVRALQLVRCDIRGRWPWDVGFRGRQPVLGPRVREVARED